MHFDRISQSIIDLFAYFDKMLAVHTLLTLLILLTLLTVSILLTLLTVYTLLTGPDPPGGQSLYAQGLVYPWA